MYQALYRKWRPRTFDEVIGQQHITDTLKTQVQSGHLSHAYIFIGTRGTGKTTCARILAKAVNCENPVDGNPCNRCRFCKGIDDGSILDIVERDAASNTGVDNVRDLREEAVFSPAAAKKRVYIIDEVHMLSLAAFNALLKIIEEPPPHLMFIMATTELQKVPATILSRCQRHSFRRIPTDQLANYLCEIAGRESIQLDRDAAMQIGRLAEGGVRDALSILDQCSGRGRITTDTVYESMGLAGNRLLVQLLDAVLRHDSTEALILFQKIWMEGKEPAVFLGELGGLLRDILILKAAPAGAEELISGNYERDILETFAAGITREELLYCSDTVQETIGKIRQLRNPRTAAELCLINICELRTSDTMLSLRARVSRLEEMVQNGAVPARKADRESSEKKSVIGISTTEHVGKDIPNDVSEDNIRICPVSIEQGRDSDIRNGSNNERSNGTFSGETATDVPDNITEQEHPENAPTDQKDLINRIVEMAKASLPNEIRFSVDDHEKMQVKLTDHDMILEIVPGFLFERMKKPENREIFAAAANEILGYPVTVRLSELSRESKPIRDINELRQFKEVTFIS